MRKNKGFAITTLDKPHEIELDGGFPFSASSG
jgi:hypothetical protein